jgi:hypothetical protein
MAVEDRFRVSGQWALVSGCELTDWILVDLASSLCFLSEPCYFYRNLQLVFSPAEDSPF